MCRRIGIIGGDMLSWYNFCFLQYTRLLRYNRQKLYPKADTMHILLSFCWGYPILILLFVIDLVINSIVQYPSSFCLLAGFTVLACYARNLLFLIAATL